MSQEWILSNFVEGYDQWDEQGDDFFSPGPTRFRRYRFILERYTQFAPPNTLHRFDVGYVGDIAEVEVNGPTGAIDILGLIAKYQDEVELKERVVSYDTGRAGVVTIRETWASTGVSDERWDDEERKWVEVIPGEEL